MVSPIGTPDVPIQPTTQSDLSIKKTENGNHGTRVSDHTTQQKISTEAIVSLKTIDPSQISENQTHTLQDLQAIADGAAQALSLFSLIDESNVESQDSFIDLLEQTHSNTEEILNKNERIRELLSFASMLTTLTPTQQDQMETHNAVSDMAQIVSYVLKQFIESSKVSDETKITAQKSLDKIQTQISAGDGIDPTSALTLPSIASSVYSVLKWMEYIKDIPGLTFAFSGATSLASTIMASIEMDKNILIDAKHRLYGKELTPLKVQLSKGTLTTAATRETPEEIKDVMVPTEAATKILEAHVEKRQNSEKSRLAKEEVIFDLRLKELSEKNHMNSFPAISEKIGNMNALSNLLKKEGIDLRSIPGGKFIETIEALRSKLKNTEPIENLKEYKLRLEYDLFNRESPESIKELKRKIQDIEFKKNLLEQRIRYKDGMTTTAKNILKECLLDNQKVNQKLFSWKLVRSKINFSASVFLGVAAVMLASVVFAGLTIAFFPVMIPTLVAIGLGAGLALAGLAILAKNKPNLLKEILKGTKIRLAFHELPRAFNAWRLKINQAELADNNVALLQFLEARPVTLEGLKAFIATPKENIPLALLNSYNSLKNKAELTIKDLEKFTFKENELLEEQKKIRGVVEKYKQQLHHFEENIHTLQNQLDVSRANDFARNTKFSVRDFELVAEGLVEGEFWQDDEVSNFMKSQLGIDLEPVKNQYISPEAKERLKAVLDKKMRNAILQNSTQLIEWLKKRGI